MCRSGHSLPCRLRDPGSARQRHSARGGHGVPLRFTRPVGSMWGTWYLWFVPPACRPPPPKVSHVQRAQVTFLCWCLGPSQFAKSAPKWCKFKTNRKQLWTGTRAGMGFGLSRGQALSCHRVPQHIPLRHPPSGFKRHLPQETVPVMLKPTQGEGQPQAVAWL